MTFAHITADIVTTIAGRLPSAARRLDNGAWVLGLPDAPADLQQACGWFAVAETPRPADTDTTTHDRTVTVVNGVPTAVWTARPWTADELATRTAMTNSTTTRTNLETALGVNRNFLGIVTPTAAQNSAQIKALTRQNVALISMALGNFDGTD